MNNTLWMFLCTVVGIVGCTAEDAPINSDTPEEIAPSTATEKAPTNRKNVTRFGETWHWLEPYHPTFDLVPLMDGDVYSSTDGQTRMFLLTRPNNADHNWDRITFTRRMAANGRWLKDGPFEEWFTDGRHRLANYRHGKLNGEFKAWYPNGQLHVRWTYIDDKINGLSEGWYENGQKQYEAQNVNDVEISGKIWNEDGTLRPNENG